jgi:alpha-ketoglutarate-dependent taurine dioxygenase
MIDELAGLLPFPSDLLFYKCGVSSIEGVLIFLDANFIRATPSNDGLISIVEQSNDVTDYSRQTAFFDLHKDGLYKKQIPDYVLLYCVEPGSEDSPTVFSDTRQVASQVNSVPDLEILRKLEVVYLSRNGNSYARPVIANHPRSGEMIINVAARAFLRPSELDTENVPIPSLRDLAKASTKMFEKLEEAIVFRHRWKKGDIVIFDNNTYVHGRYASKRDVERKLVRIWLSLDNPYTKSGGLHRMPNNALQPTLAQLRQLG